MATTAERWEIVAVKDYDACDSCDCPLIHAAYRLKDEPLSRFCSPLCATVESLTKVSNVHSA